MSRWLRTCRLVLNIPPLLGLSNCILKYFVLFADFCSLSRVWKELKSCCRSLNCRFFIPMYPSRFAFITFANLCNWALAIVSFYFEFTDFASYLLSIFMANLVLYTMFYILMKVSRSNRKKIILNNFFNVKNLFPIFVSVYF